ncbi:MAG: molybdate ABC transporter substrate-binding protein [Candidatus Reddybacter sp.]
MTFTVFDSLKQQLPSFKAHCLCLLFTMSLSICAQAEQVTAAIAANFAGTIKYLKPLFERESGHRLVTSFASSGTLFAQIHHGAPFDVFLSADEQRPQQLIDGGMAVADSAFIYTTGLLVLWSSQPELIDPQGNILRAGHWSDKNIRHIALANPKTAPYGRAALQTLETMQLVDAMRPYRVTGQNIAQTFQFVASGNAQLGFIAQAQVLALPESERGSSWRVPQAMYSPIQQEAVMLMRGRENSAAKAFLQFLQSPRAKKIIRARGYQ